MKVPRLVVPLLVLAAVCGWCLPAQGSLNTVVFNKTAFTGAHGPELGYIPRPAEVIELAETESSCPQGCCSSGALPPADATCGLTGLHDANCSSQFQCNGGGKNFFTFDSYKTVFTGAHGPELGYIPRPAEMIELSETGFSCPQGCCSSGALPPADATCGLTGLHDASCTSQFQCNGGGKNFFTFDSYTPPPSLP